MQCAGGRRASCCEVFLRDGGVRECHARHEITARVRWRNGRNHAEFPKSRSAIA
ncbi:MAG: hypothetical protein ACK559_10990 [bacterium]